MRKKHNSINHSKKITLESIEYYQQNIEAYNKILAECERKRLSPNISEKMKYIYGEFIKVVEKEKRNCGKEIENLLSK